MNRRYKFLTAFVLLVAIVAAFAFYLFRVDDSAKRAAETTRNQLRQEGFKTDLSEFNFFTPANIRARERFLTNPIGRWNDKMLSEYHPSMKLLHVVPRFLPDMMDVLGSNAAPVLPQRELKYPSGEDYWMDLRHQLSGEDAIHLDRACDVLISAPIRFHLDASRGVEMLLPHLSSMKHLEQTLGARVVLFLHDTNRAAAWTNLLASTRLATAWDPEPTEFSHMVRYSCARIAFNTMWQALQTGGWSEDQLTQLEHEWASADFLKGLPDIAAFSRAGWVAKCTFEREQPFPTNTTSIAQMIRSPRIGFSELQDRVRMARYREFGGYEDERGLLLHYRDRELQLRRAIRASTWSEMRALPIVTTHKTYTSKFASALQIQLNSSEISRGALMRGTSLCAQAAEAETRRRIVLAALALERYKLKRTTYPKTLSDLATEGFKPAAASALVDFMDGKPLRYRPTDNGNFLIYSTGLDCADDGGTAETETSPGGHQWRTGTLQTGKDIVWPRPATREEIQAEEDRKQAELNRWNAQRSALGLPK